MKKVNSILLTEENFLKCQKSGESFSTIINKCIEQIKIPKVESKETNNEDEVPCTNIQNRKKF